MVDKTNMIALLKKTILLKKRKNIHDNIKLQKVSVSADNTASLQKVEAVNLIELDDEKLVSGTVKFPRIDTVQIYIGKALKKILSLNDEIRELKVLVCN